MSKEYPALMVGDGGYEAIERGHGLSAERIAEVEAAMIGAPPDGWFTEVEECWFWYTPRIKNCRRYTEGWSCDSEGEWHHHWVALRPNDNPDTRFTVIRHTDLDPSESHVSEEGANRG